MPIKLPDPYVDDQRNRRNFERLAGQFPVGTENLAVVPAARVTHSVAQSIPNSTVTFLSFDTERFDTQDLHDNSTNNSRLTAPIDGIYLITAHVEFASNSTGRRQLALRASGSTFIALTEPDTNQNASTHLSLGTVYELSADGYVEVRVFQNSGGSLNVGKTDEFTPEFTMTWIGKTS